MFLYKNKNRTKRTMEDIVVDFVVGIIMIIVLFVILYPIIYIFSNSISYADAVMKKEVLLLPKGFNLQSYKMIFDHEYIIPSYMNTLYYVSLGTIYSMILTVFGAYALSKKRLFGRNTFMFLIAFTMLFNGGLIPTYLLVNSLNMVNKRSVMIIPMAVSAYNLIVMRTSFQQTPESLEESAKIDGANDLYILFRIYIPLNLAVVATITLFYVVAKWNDFFQALVYLNDKKLFPLQMILRELLITADDNTLNRQTVASDTHGMFTPMGFRSSVTIISMLPLLIIYPFLQKYFVKGIMIGSIKG